MCSHTTSYTQHLKDRPVLVQVLQKIAVARFATDEGALCYILHKPCEGEQFKLDGFLVQFEFSFPVLWRERPEPRHHIHKQHFTSAWISTENQRQRTLSRKCMQLSFQSTYEWSRSMMSVKPSTSSKLICFLVSFDFKSSNLKPLPVQSPPTA